MSVRRSVLVLGSLTAFGPLSLDLYLPALPNLGDDLQTNESMAQLTMAACMLGLGLGQFVFGPMSDRYGRKIPIIVGVSMFTLFSVLCAFAPNIGVLLLFRFLQGVGGSAGQSVARACVRDMYDGSLLVRMFSLLMLVSGAAPILAPVIGGALTLVMDWRGTFLVLAGIGATLTLVAVLGLRETLPAERRSPGGFGHVIGSFGLVVRDRIFLVMMLALSFTTASFTSYLTMSSFVFQQEFALTPVGFSLLFAINSVAIITGAQVNGLLSRRFSSTRLLTVALSCSAVATVSLMITAMIGSPLAVVAVLLTCVMFFQGWVMPNSTAIALQRHGRHAGSASALLGAVQFTVGPTVGPLVSLIAVSAQTLSTTMAIGVVGALLVVLLFLPKKPEA